MPPRLAEQGLQIANSDCGFASRVISACRAAISVRRAVLSVRGGVISVRPASILLDRLWSGTGLRAPGHQNREYLATQCTRSIPDFATNSLRIGSAMTLTAHAARCLTRSLVVRVQYSESHTPQ